MRTLLLNTAIALLLLQGGTVVAQSGFTVDFSWADTTACFDPKSPPFSLQGVPAGTKQLRFVITDLDAPNFVHGGGTVAYAGQDQVDRGAFSYRGPCPPSGQHTYRWTIEALDAAGRTLATATVSKRFPP